MKRIGKITTTTVAQGMDAGGEWQDLGPHFGNTPKQMFEGVRALIGKPGFGWQGAQIIERTVIEYPTGYQILRRPNASGEGPPPSRPESK